MRRTWIVATLVFAGIGCGGLVEQSDPVQSCQVDGRCVGPDGDSGLRIDPPWDGGRDTGIGSDDGGEPDADPYDDSLGDGGLADASRYDADWPRYDAGPYVEPPVGHCLSLQVAKDGSAKIATFDIGGDHASWDGPSVAIEGAASIGSIGEHDQKLYACNGHVVEFAADGSANVLDMTCSAVTADASSIWVDSAERGLERFDSVASVVAATPSATFPSLGSDRITVNGDVLLAASDGPNVSTIVRRIDTKTGIESTTTMNLLGVRNTGISIGDDTGIFAVFTGSWVARLSPTGSLQTASSGTPQVGTFHGLVCH